METTTQPEVIRSSDEGQGLAEYALILVFIAIVAIVALTFLGTSISSILSTVANSLSIIDRLRPQRAFFTHMCHDLGHEATNAKLPEHVRLSYDGMKLDFEI